VIIVLVVLVIAGVVGGGIWMATKGQKKMETPITEPTQTEVLPTVAVESNEESTGSGEIAEIVIEADNYAFTPAKAKVKKGDTVSLTLVSNQGIHSLVIDELEVETNEVNAGEEETVEFVASKAGTYEYYCPKHRTEGMKGTLTVE